jgi:hypothetical protein
MNPVPSLILASGLCVSAAQVQYNSRLLDGSSSTQQHLRDFQESVSQAGIRESVIIEKTVTLEETIDAVCADPDNFEEGEAHPSPTAISELKRILIDASDAFNGDIPPGNVAPYFGEVSVTWRCDNRMLRLTAFSDGRQPRLDFGTTPEGSLGDYEFYSTATGKNVSDRLNWLLADRAAAA